MFATLKKDREMINGDNGEDTVVSAGRHEIERINNPLGHNNAPWLVLKGTRIGQAEKAWRQSEDGEIIIEE